MSALITGSAVRTCLGDAEATFDALVHGRAGVGDLRHFRPASLNVARGYQILDDEDDEHENWFKASGWLTDCIRDALAQSGVNPEHERVVAIVGTGLRELRAVERWAAEPMEAGTERLHFDTAVRQASPHIAEVITLSNACSAGGHALALAQDLVELGEADAVIAAGADGMTESMLGMIGRFATTTTERVRPFDRHRTGVLLGDGAAAQVVVAEGHDGRPLARILSTGLSCDAFHDTAPSADGIWRAIEDAFSRARRRPEQVDVVVAHGTGTALNDPLEASLFGRLFGPKMPLITGVKGAVGHTSGAAALVNAEVAIRCLQTGVVPPMVGLTEPIAEARALRFVIGVAADLSCRLALINAFGFGGVNAVTLLEAIA